MTPQPDDTRTTHIEGRSEIARFLGKEVWPAGREALLEVARTNHATDGVVSRLSSLPADVTFENVQEVSEHLGLAAPEAHGAGAD